jgi:hypothetical protein
VVGRDGGQTNLEYSKKVKVNFIPEQTTKAKRGVDIYFSILSFTSSSDWMGGQSQPPVALLTSKRSGTHCTGGWVAPGTVWTVA